MEELKQLIQELIDKLSQGYIDHNTRHDETQDLINLFSPTNKELMTKELGLATFERTDYLMTTINNNHLKMMTEVMNNQAKLISINEKVDRIQGLTEAMHEKIVE